MKRQRLHIPDGDASLCHAKGKVLLAPQRKIIIGTIPEPLPKGGWAALGVNCKRCLLRHRLQAELFALLVDVGRRDRAKKRYGETPTGTVSDIDYFGGG